MINHPNRSTRTFGLIKVATPESATGELHLHFSSRDAFDEAVRAIEKAGHTINDKFWGYSLYRSAQDALDAVNVFAPRPKSFGELMSLKK